MLSRKLLLSANAQAGRGGQGLNLAQMMEGLSGLFDVEVFSQSQYPTLPSRRIEHSKAAETIARIPVLRRLRNWQVLLNEIHFDEEVSRFMGSADFFQGTTGQCLNSLKVAKARGCKTFLDVITLHNDVYSEALNLESRRFGMSSVQHPILSRRILEEYKWADLIRVMSEPARQTFLDRGFDEQRVFVASPPFDLSRFPETRFTESEFNISFVGLIEPAKGFHYLVEGFRKLNRPDARLLLWGGTGTRQMAAFIREQSAQCPTMTLMPYSVAALGYEKVYGISSVLVHPSLADGFGYVVGEAMACGLPVITTTATGASEWVKDGVNGFVVSPRDSDAIRDRLEYLMDHPAVLRRMGQEARATMRQLTLERFRDSYRTAIDCDVVPVAKNA